ncbi:MAG: DUF92 domain-containing protein [Clostridia bacterium]|nr:DUF92 domain-containing protein [Clostridia bacterium]
MILKGYIFSIAYVLVCVLAALAAYKLGVPKKFTRKIVHILVGFEWVILYHFFGVSVHFLIVCLIFLTLLAIDYKVKLVPAMSSDGDNAPGTVYYAVAMTVMASVSLLLPRMILPFGIAVFCTSFGDGFAGVLGQLIKRFNKKIYAGKTLIGTLSNLVVSFLVPLLFSFAFGLDINVFYCLAIAVLAVELELIADRGLDNLLITIAVSLFSYGLMYIPGIVNYLAPILLTPLIVIFAKKKRALTDGAIAGALLLDVAVSVSFGNFGFVILALFFVGSILADKVKKMAKKTKQKSNLPVKNKTECRNIMQVFANGAMALFASIAFLVSGERVFLVMYVASLAEAFSDTVASGVGALSDNVFDLFRFERCEPGLSGGMSVVGTLFSLVSAASLSLVALALSAINPIEALLVTFSAFLGAVFDSMLGSLLQGKYICPVCKRVVEKKEHCGAETELYRGFSAINNDVVNGLSTVFAATLSAVFFIFI